MDGTHRYLWILVIFVVVVVVGLQNVGEDQFLNGRVIARVQQLPLLLLLLLLLFFGRVAFALR